MEPSMLGRWVNNECRWLIGVVVVACCLFASAAVAADALPDAAPAAPGIDA
jgi:hypothetical protein